MKPAPAAWYERNENEMKIDDDDDKEIVMLMRINNY